MMSSASCVAFCICGGWDIPERWILWQPVCCRCWWERQPVPVTFCPINGEKEWIGILTAYDTEQITIQPEEQEAPVTLPLADLSYVRRYVTVEF